MKTLNLTFLIPSLFLFSCILFLSGNVSAQPVYTGNAAADFPASSLPNLFTFDDATNDVGVGCFGQPTSPNGVAPIGFDVDNIHFYYDSNTDTLYIGMDMVGIAGDGDGDGDPSNATLCSSYDLYGQPIDFEEEIGIMMDVDQDGNWDYFIGWPQKSVNFGLYEYTSSSSLITVPQNGNLRAITQPNPNKLVGATFFRTPNAVSPDPEFKIGNYSQIDPDIQAIFYSYTESGTNGEDLDAIGFVSLPVSLSHFSGIFKENQIVLNWETEKEINNDGFTIEMADEDGQFNEIGFEYGQGNSDILTSYEFNVTQFSNGWNYFRLKQIDYDGAYTYSDQIAVRVDQSSLKLTVAFDKNEIRIHSLEHENGFYRVINVSGQTLISGKMNATGTDISTQHLASGVYFVQMITQHDELVTQFIK